MAKHEKRQAADEPQVFEQTEDEFARIRLDRPHTGEEAAAQDAEHRRTHEERAARFTRQRRL